MGAGAFVSALLHGGVIALTLIAWPRLMPDDLPDQVVPVELLPPSEETNIMAQSKAEKPESQESNELSQLSPEARLARGENIYRQLCASCHGKNGEGVAKFYEDPLVGDATIGELTQLIHDTMPEEDPERTSTELIRFLS